QMREIMASLGIRTIDELVGRSDLLIPRDYDSSRRASKLDLTEILSHEYASIPEASRHFNPADAYDFKLESTIDETAIIPALKDAFEKGVAGEADIKVSNTNRTVGTIFGSKITRKFGTGLAEDTYVVHCHGAGGQSFGAFIPSGLTLALEGDSNDYLGKGLSGGKIVVFPPKESTRVPQENIITGNVALFGATSGKAFINGVAGERFCVRNSGASVVVEGTGDHGCEYMTGGVAVILGGVGKNFAAGMSGGVAYVLDEGNDLYTKLNKSLVGFSHVEEEEDIAKLRGLIEEHVKWTSSPLGSTILEKWDEYLPKFKKVIPHDYAWMMRGIRNYMGQGMAEDEAKIHAFNDKFEGGNK
ncbi:MAG: glutamate synthase subunit alpha, partial [Clostridiales bacterium]|nr:glutamate synthase subunit alpha [Clostridiales bacterium]